MPAEPWRIIPKPSSNAGHTANIAGSMAGTIKIMPSTSNTEEMVNALAMRIAAIPVYEEALKTLACGDDRDAQIARDALAKGGL